MEEIDKEHYQEAAVLFIQAQQEEAKWKAHLLMNTDMLEGLSNIEDLGFTAVIQRFGKQCIKVNILRLCHLLIFFLCYLSLVPSFSNNIMLFILYQVLNERAQTKAADPAYRTRGLKDAIQVARYAQTIIGPEKLANDTSFGEMREEWLSYSELQGANLEGSQAELLNELIMAYLEAESVMTNESSANDMDLSSTVIQDGPEPIWEKYQRALEHATARSNDNF